MTLYARIVAGAVSGYIDYATPPDLVAAARKGIDLRPVEETKATGEVITGPVVTVLADKVTRVWTGRAKTPGEIDAEKTAQIDGEAALVFGKVLFDQENRLRVLEGRPSVTAAQFKNALKALL